MLIGWSSPSTFCRTCSLRTASQHPFLPAIALRMILGDTERSSPQHDSNALPLHAFLGSWRGTFGRNPGAGRRTRQYLLRRSFVCLATIEIVRSDEVLEQVSPDPRVTPHFHSQPNRSLTEAWGLNMSFTTKLFLCYSFLDQVHLFILQNFQWTRRGILE